MIDEILAGIFDEGEFVVDGQGASRRAQLIVRLCFGLLGAGLATAGAVRFAWLPPAANPAFAASIVAMFAFLGCFCLFNIALARTWRWPGLLFAVSFAAMFVTRIAFGP